MCDQHWDRDVHRHWHGPVPPDGAVRIGRPSLLVVRFPGSDEVLVVSVLYRDIATLRAPGTVVRTVPFLDSGFSYVADVLAAGDAAGMQAFAPDGEPLFYHYVERDPGGS
ncbi:hypothetical protein [Dactylosporangium sp. NPDC050588]|uniref:hypothetical protein n=1 Tax=Dactylosporangium sp. NPDC050588 TaxID=3157211 RepID=UPI00340DB255